MAEQGIITRLIKAAFGLVLMPLNIKIFDAQKVFKDKRIAIVGPASSSLEKENGDFINGFDLVIRVNKAPHQMNEKNAPFIGAKTDILFHSFYENHETGGGPLDFNLYKKLGIQYVIAPRSDKKGRRVIFNFFKKYNRPYTVYTLSSRFYSDMLSGFGRYWPSIGYCAIYSVIGSNFKEMFITGFTFFKTPYASGYRDNLIDLEVNQTHMKTHGLHNADTEFSLFLELLEANSHKNISFDNALSYIVKQYN